MLLAEIHGKRCPDIEGVEDLFTSAVFGHLRSIPPKFFWRALFSKAWNLERPACSLQQKLQNLGVELSLYDSLNVAFWPNFAVYGEPDLIFQFTGPNCEPFLVLIEVKLYSTKSGLGENDQLAKYLRLLADTKATEKWSASKNHRFVIYLTRNFASDEIEASLAAFALDSGDARPLLFGLEWRDVLETASRVNETGMGTVDSNLLSEVVQFLKTRGFDGFNGFHSAFPIAMSSGSFYQRLYFRQDDLKSETSGGYFYGN